MRFESSETPDVAGMILIPKGPRTTTSVMCFLPSIRSLTLNFGTMPNMMSILPSERSASNMYVDLAPCCVSR